MRSPLVAICAATYQRPKMLAQLLESLSKLNLHGLNVHLIIADNDMAESAKETVTSVSESMPFPTTYIVEPVRGLASVRNRLVAEARTISADYIAFIDDDEQAHSDWLKELVNQAQISQADAVAGKHTLWLDYDVSAAIKQCYQTKELKTTTPVKRFGTNNVLLRMSALNGIEGPFDTRLNLTGGEDSLLSAQLHQRGARMVHSGEAKTYEYVPRTRAQPRYILERAFRTGTTRSKIVRWSDPDLKDYLLQFGHSIGIIVKHGSLMIPNVVTRRDLLLFRLKCIVSGLGGIAGLITTKAYTHQEYATTHGS